MSKVKWKGGTLLAPVPASLITVGDGEKDNIFTVSWTGIINTQPPKTYISVRPTRYSYDFIKRTGEFVINLTPQSLVKAADWCGVYTGRKVDKWKRMNLTREAANEVKAPLIAECPMSLECRVFDVVEMETHHMFLADIVAVDVDEKLIDKNGKLCVERADLMAYAHGEYFALGKSLGKFGFAVKKKKKRPASSPKSEKNNKNNKK